MNNVVSISPERALDTYERVFGESGRDDRAASIVAHLQRVATAPTVEDAENVISWWDCWKPRGPHYLRRTVRRLRQLLGSPKTPDAKHKCPN